MPRARLLLTVEDVPGPRLPGDLVEGRVELLVDEPLDCEGIFVRLDWKTGAGANRASGKGAEVPVPGGGRAWKPREPAPLPFALPVPAGPPTYRGRKLEVEWTVVARAGIPWGFDPEEGAPVEVGPAPAGDGELVEMASSGAFEFGCALSCTIIFLACAAVVGFSGGYGGALFFIVGGLAGLVALFMIPISMGYRRAGKVRVEVGPVPASPGGEMAVRLTAVPRKDLAPRSVKAHLECVEHTVHGSGKSKSTKKETLAKVDVDLEGPERAPALQEAVWAGILRLPGDAPPSLAAGPHKVEWRVKAVIAIDWLPDPDWDIAVTVAG